MILSIAALVILVVFASLYGNAWHLVSFTIFGVTMLLLYTSSTLLHAFRPGRAKDFFEIMDHTSIYFFIAGTYTPFLFLAVDGGVGWTLFGIVWGLAMRGNRIEILFRKKIPFHLYPALCRHGLVNCLRLERSGHQFTSNQFSLINHWWNVLYGRSHFLYVEII